MIATDHSPHTLDEKGCDINGKIIKPAIWDCISGFCGVETGVPLISDAGQQRPPDPESICQGGQREPGQSLADVPEERAQFASAPTATSPSSTWTRKHHRRQQAAQQEQAIPWGGWKVKGMPVYTIVRGNVQMKDGEPFGKAVGRMQTPIIS